jgi:hypothetical protein
MELIRCSRALRTFQSKDSTVGKLFAKHIKLEEAKQFLQRARYAYYDLVHAWPLADHYTEQALESGHPPESQT